MIISLALVWRVTRQISANSLHSHSDSQWKIVRQKPRWLDSFSLSFHISNSTLRTINRRGPVLKVGALSVQNSPQIVRQYLTSRTLRWCPESVLKAFACNSPAIRLQFALLHAGLSVCVTILISPFSGQWKWIASRPSVFILTRTFREFVAF